MKKRIYFALSIMFSTAFNAISSTPEPADKAPAFEVGEKLTYSLGWQFVTVGYARTSVLPETEHEGSKVRNFKMIAKTNSFADRIFKVRDELFSMTEKNLNRSISFTKKQREGKTKRDVTVDFDWKERKAKYAEALKNKKRETPIQEKTLDPLSAFYYVRMQDMDVGTVISGPITDGKRCKEAEIRVVARETIKVKGKEYDTFKLVPDLKDVGGVFEKSKDAKIEIWVTADHRRIPVRMKSKVIVGSFIAELEEA